MGRNIISNFLYLIIRAVMAPIINLFFIGRVNGRENIPKRGGYIIAANHCSYIDHFIVQCTIVPKLSTRIHYLAKKEHFDSWFQRKWHTGVGAIPIDRKGGGKKALKWAIEALESGRIIGIYPEGTRSLNGKIQRGKTGVARLAVHARVPVLPVGLIGTIKILPKGKMVPKLRKAKVNIGKLMFFDKYYGKEDNHKVIRKITNNLMKEIARLSRQEYKNL